jgi:hypothetical protein
MRNAFSVLLPILLIPQLSGGIRAAELKIQIRSEPANNGQINPKLFGNFIELLEDVVPGTWAEMLNDRSFEGVTRPSNWCYYDGSPTICDRQWEETGNCEYVIGHAFNGQRSAKLTAAKGHPASLSQSGLAVTKGMLYRFSGYFRAEDPAVHGAVILKSLMPDGTWMEMASADLPSLKNDWEKCSLTLKSAGASDRTIFELRVTGHGALWADKLSLMPGDNLNGWRRDVIEVIRDAHPSLIRWGGSVCDPGEYRWKNGIGDRDLRVPFPNKVWGRIDSNDVGIDEFCQFCGLVNAEPLICLSFSDGPQNAADLVEYCNGGVDTVWGARRAANGHSEPYQVKYWQAGNEISGDNEEYLSQLGEFARLMKAKDPSLALCSSFPSRKLVERFGGQLSFVCPHHYTIDFAFCDRELTEVTQLLESIPDCSQTRIAVTEWNISGGDWGLMRARQMTLTAALMNARYLNLLMRHCDRVEMACRSNLANSFCGAIIETSPTGVLRRPSYHVMRLYARHAKPVPLTILTSTDALDLFACGSRAKSSLVVFGVNSGKEPLNASFEFADFPQPIHIAGAEVVGDIWDARQPDVMNHWNAAERVSTRRLDTAARTITFPALSAVAVEMAAEGN